MTSLVPPALPLRADADEVNGPIQWTIGLVVGISLAVRLPH